MPVKQHHRVNLDHRGVLVTAWLALCILNLPAGTSAATESSSPRFSIDIWKTDDLLPQHSVIAMTQTRDGYLWLGTLNGLVRFDGARFTVYDEANTPGLNSSRIVSLFEDSHDTLWVGTETTGVLLVKGGAVRSFDPGRGSREGRLMSICEDTTSAVWLFTADAQLYRYRDGRASVWKVAAEGDDEYRVVFAEASGLLWVGTEAGLTARRPTDVADQRDFPSQHRWAPAYRLDFALPSKSGGHWRLADGRIQKWKADQFQGDLAVYPWDTNAVRVAAACEDDRGNLVIGTDSGVYWFNAAGRAKRLSRGEGMSNDWIISLHFDREGSLWVGTDGGGLNRVRQSPFELLKNTEALVVQSVSEDSQGGLWIGANNGGVSHWKDGSLQRPAISAGGIIAVNPVIPVRAVLADQQQRVWAGAWGEPFSGLYQLQGGHFQRVAGPAEIQQPVLAIHQDRNSRLWFGTPAGLVFRDERGWKVFTTREGLSANVVRAIADDAQGNLWVGTEGGGMNLLRDGKFTHFRKQAGGLPSDDISSLLVDEEGAVWVGTFGSGLARLQGGRWTQYSTQDGLVSNGIGYLLEDGRGFMWIGSVAGLMRVSKKSLKDFTQGQTNSIIFRTYRVADGLPTGECTQGSQPGACRARDGKLWFPTINGLVGVDPARLRSNPLPPPVIIESVVVQGETKVSNALKASLPASVIIPPGKERLEIQFTSLNLGARNRALFRYRMEGHETTWTPPSESPFAIYPKLPQGHYRFRVSACNEDGVWNETGASIAITVQPPFWQTWWFLSATAVGLLGCLVAGVHYFSTQKLQRQLEHLRQQEALEKERSRIARDLHDQLGANLTQVALLGELVESDKDVPEEVESHARQISRTARETTRSLDEIVWAANPANDTLEGLVTYACKYAQDYLTLAGLRYRLDVPAELPAATIAPDLRHNLFLAFKEAVNNVVKHAQASEAWLRLQMEPGHFTLEIEDNGRGLAGMNEPAAAARNGLRNMRKRMEDVGGSFSIGPGKQGGTLVRLGAPLGNG